MQSFVGRAGLGIAAACLPAAAFGQANLGAEVVGQPIQVTTNGVTNTVVLNPGGQMQIITPRGNTIQGLWKIASGNLCLGAGGAQECVPYNSPFQPQQPRTLTSSCGSTATWVAQATNNATRGQRGERGR